MMAPIAVFAFKRAELLAATLRDLAANEGAALSDLYIFCDGPKKPEDSAKTTAARDVARAASGFKSVTVVERDNNIGLAKSIKAGVSELCAKFGRVIVVEDDLELSPDFLRYTNTALDRYAQDERVMQVAGHMWNVPLDVAEDALFMSLTTSLGWGTWARAWEQYTEDLSDFDRADSQWLKRFDLDGNFPYSAMLKRTRAALIDSWAIYWYYSVFRRSGLTIYPRTSLVAHRGFDDVDRTHGHGKIPWATTVGRLHSVIAWPADVVSDRRQKYIFFALNPSTEQTSNSIARVMSGVRRRLRSVLE
jgi:GT2 family glycosyltransferase